jgi:isopenicillin N synthase-like dioxygenase
MDDEARKVRVVIRPKPHGLDPRLGSFLHIQYFHFVLECHRKPKGDVMTTQTIFQCSSETQTLFDPTIPVIDMQDWKNPNRRTKFVKDLDEAFRDVGFVAVVNPGVNGDILDRAYAQAKEFFSLDEKVKKKLYDPQLAGQRGYVPGETAKGCEKKDYKEFLHVGREYTQEQYERLKYAKNIWMDHDELKNDLLSLLTELEQYMNPFLEAIAEAMNQPCDFLTKMTQEGDCLLRALHYFPTIEGTVVGAEHTDIDLIAILPRATCEGLQVQLREGKWVDVRVPEGAFVVNAGDMLESLTNGYYKSARHRVVAPGGNKDRFSKVFFVHPRPKDSVGPLKEYIKETGGKRLYPEGTRDEYLHRRLLELGLGTKEMAQKLIASGFLERCINLGDSCEACIKRIRNLGVKFL